PQGALSVGLGANPHNLDLSIYNVLLQDDVKVEDVLIKTNVDGLHLLPANIDLSAAEIQLVSEVAREMALARVLRPLRKDYDFILIDCQPSLGLLAINALTCAHGVDRKSTRLNSSHVKISYAVFCLKKNFTSSTLTLLRNRMP